MPEEGGLLEEELSVAECSEPHGARWHRPLILLSAVAAAGMVVATVLLPRVSVATMASPSEVQEKGLLSASDPSSQTCYIHTGTTCHLAALGVQDTCSTLGATCKGGDCQCEGSCAGSDNRCHFGELNTLVASDFGLLSLKDPRYGMYFQSVTATGIMKTSAEPGIVLRQKDKFALHQLPGPKGKTPKFILGSERWPNLVARVTGTMGTAAAAYAAYATEFSKEKKPSSLAVSVCWDKKKQAMMIGNSNATEFAYVRRGSWKVYGTNAKKCSQELSSLWQPSPMFTPEQISALPQCC